MKKCTLFAGGVIEDISFIDAEAVRKTYVICADSGLEYAERMNIRPDLIVGDFDSYKGELPDETEIHRSIPEKDDTDTILAVRIAAERGYDEIELYGALGKRFDHAFANIQTLMFAKNLGCSMKICDCENEISLCGCGEYSFPKHEDWYFSLFSLTEETFIEKLSGVKYPLENYVMTMGYPIGVSNEITEEEACLRIKSGILLVVKSKR